MPPSTVSASQPAATERADERMTGSFPRTYRTDASTRRTVNGLAIFLAVFGVSITAFDLLREGPHLGLFALPVLFTLIALGMAFRINQTVVLSDDAVAIHTWFSRRSLVRGAIKGYRTDRLPWQAGGGSYYVIVAADSKARDLKLPAFLHRDQAFLAWIQTLTQLDR